MPTSTRLRPIARSLISSGSWRIRKRTTPKRRTKKDKDKDKKKAEVLSQKINQLQKQLGPEFDTIDNVLNHLDIQSPDGREIALIIQRLNEFCPE